MCTAMYTSKAADRNVGLVKIAKDLGPVNAEGDSKACDSMVKLGERRSSV